MNNKKITVLFILIAFLTLIGIGFTVAYFTSSTDFENVFQTGLYQTQATETFTSPNNWLPGDETPKTLIIKNIGNVDVKARVCVSENWVASDGYYLPLFLENGERVAIINFDNTSDWTRKGDCYEYNDTLEPNEQTSSFIESVTFNPNTENYYYCDTIVENGTTTKTCEGVYGYDNANYTLTLRVETVQANKSDELWPSPTTFYTLDSTSIGSNSENLTKYYNQREITSLSSVFFKHIVDNNEIIESYLEYAAFDENGRIDNIYSFIGGGSTINEERTQLLGYTVYNDDSIYYDSNKNKLQTIFGSSKCSESNNFDLILNKNSLHYSCLVSYGGYAFVDPTGRVGFGQGVAGGGYECSAQSDGSTGCEMVYGG